jgi:outer membrane autotransporter protein
LFELTPTVSDKLLVSGKLGIASGATLTLTADRPLTPGTKLDLIVANGGITGSFATINKPSTVAGVLTQSADRIQLLATFLNGGFNPQVTAAVDYVNALLVAGQASAPLIAAMPKLLNSDGATSGAAFAQVTPEAYASATQIGVENGLVLAQASRNAALTGGRDAGFFSFGQALGNWRKLDGRAAQGVSRANINSRGVMGGAAYGSASASIGVFVGYLDSKQRIDPIAARTDADGVIAGIAAHYAAGAFDLSGLIAYDGANADTSRTLPGSSKASGHYRLHSWTGDLAAGYRFPLGVNWGVKSSAGLTYVSVRRGGADEGAVNPLALQVIGRRSNATFLDGSLALEGGLAPSASFHPWLSAGIRYQTNGRTSAATAGFVGSSLDFTAEGVARQRSLPTSGAGFTLDVGPRLALYGAYRHEFGREGGGDSLNGGVRFRF